LKYYDYSRINGVLNTAIICPKMKSVLNRWTIEEEAKNWMKAIFVFDSSTLLNFYEFSEST